MNNETPIQLYTATNWAQLNVCRRIIRTYTYVTSLSIITDAMDKDRKVINSNIF